MTYLGTQTDLSDQQNIGIVLNISFAMIMSNPDTSEQSLMSISDDSFFGYKKKVIVILDRIRPLSPVVYPLLLQSPKRSVVAAPIF